LITASFLKKKTTAIERVKLFREIERFIFIIFRISRALSNFRNSEFYNAAREIYREGKSIETVIGQLHHNMLWTFNNGDFDIGHFQKFLDRKFKNNKGFYDWNGVRYFLYEYELDKLKKRGNKKVDWKAFIKNERDKISLEHVFPQTPNDDCWDNIMLSFSTDEVKKLNGTLGNLVPLSMSINSSLQNDCFEEKKKAKFNEDDEKIRFGYNDGSHSEIEIATQYEKWGAEEILNRGLSLLAFLEKRWNINLGSRENKVTLLYLDFLIEEN